MSLKIAYIMSRFPGLSETFILREMDAMQSLGWDLVLYPLIVQRETVVHKEAEPWLDKARRLSWLAAFAANISIFGRNPLHYISVLGNVIRENLPSMSFLLRALVLFPKAVWMAREMENEKISHIHAHYATHPSLVAWVINQFTGISYSVTVHAHDIYINRTMLTVKLRSALFVAAISNYNRQYLIDHLGSWVGDKTYIVHCGINPDQYLSHFSHRENKEKFEILSVGTLRPYKGQKYLIDACIRLRQRNIPFRCRIVGGGDLYDDLSKQIIKMDLQDCVELMGPKTQEDVTRLLTETDCYVQPSIILANGRMEGIPVSLMEALASAIPTVATSISGIPELIRHGETGWLVPPENIEMLAEAIINVYNNLEDASRVGGAGREWVLNEFDLHDNVSILSNLFLKFIPKEMIVPSQARLSIKAGD
jgi:glycosyltransferase involved in cell wall biosynthesis